jgi:hypothetical protein
MSLFAQTIRSRNALLLGAVLVGVLGYVYYCLFVDYSMGGNSWKQGDWLINELAGPIRRGLFGSALLHVSDALGANPLVLLIVLQASIVTLIFAVLGIAAFDLKVPDKLLLILLSPGFVIFFWFNDPLGSMRKELLTYLAFVPLVVAALRGRGGYAAYAFSTVAYGVAMSAHEGNVFFLPFLCTAMWLILPPEASIRLRLALLAVPCLLAFGGGLYASLYTHVSDYSVLCAPLLRLPHIFPRAGTGKPAGRAMVVRGHRVWASGCAALRPRRRLRPLAQLSRELARIHCADLPPQVATELAVRAAHAARFCGRARNEPAHRHQARTGRNDRRGPRQNGARYPSCARVERDAQAVFRERCDHACQSRPPRYRYVLISTAR